MSEETMKDLCRAYHYNIPIEKIAEAAKVTVADVKQAIFWGYETAYFKELKTGRRME